MVTTVYLVDEPFLDVALTYALKDTSAKIVLLQDAVYSPPGGDLPLKVFAVLADVARRGLNGKIPPSVSIIGYDELVKMMEDEKVVNFL